MVTALNPSNCRKGTLQAAFILFAGFAVLLMVSHVPIHAQSGESIEHLFQKAQSHYIFNEREDAEELFTRIMDELCKSSDEHHICIESKIYLSMINRYSSNYDASEYFLDRAEQLAVRTIDGEDPIFINIYSQRGYLYEVRDKMKDARYWADRAMDFAYEHQPGTEGLARAKNINGYILNSEGNYHKAIVYYNEALSLLSELERDIVIMRLFSQVHTNIGVVYRHLGDLENAVKHYESAREVITEALGESHYEMAYIYNNLGSVYYVLGDHGRAAEYFIRSGNILVDNFGENNDFVAMAYNNAGITYLQLGETGRGFEYLERSQEIKLNIHGEDHTETAVGYNNLATYYRLTGQSELAEKNYLRSIEIRINIYDDNHPSLISPLQTLAGLYNEQKKFEKAREQLRKALEIGLDRFTFSHPDIIDIYSLIAASYSREGKPETALEYFDRTITYITGGDTEEIPVSELLRSVTYPLKLIENIRSRNRVLLSLYEKGGDKDHLYEILHYSSIASEIIDHLQTSFQYEASKLNLLDTNYEVYAMALDVIYELYSKTGESRWADEMFFLSETSKSRIAMELLQGLDALQFGGVPEEVIAQERELNALVTGYFQQLGLEQEKGDEADSRLVRQYRDSLFYAQRELNEFSRSLEENYPSYYALKYDRQIVTLEKIRSQLGSGENLIAYTTGREYHYAILLTEKDVHIERLANYSKIEKSISLLKELKETGNSEGFREASHSLYVQLFAPLEDRMSGESLIILPDASLHYLPFELLLTAESDEIGRVDYHRLPFLIKRYDMRYSPSASVMLSRRENRLPDPRNFLALAPFNEPESTHIRASSDEALNDSDVSRYLNSLAPLPLTGYETREISRLFSQRNTVRSFFFPERTEVLTGRRASRSRVVDGRLDDYSYIHIATHAFINDRNPSLSGIALHPGSDDNGILYVGDIYNLQMNADLVVLGACDTGLGEIRKGEGMVGFSRAFFYAGASNLMVSMWKVNDQSTAHFMIEFYRNIRKGKSYSASLREAKLNFIDHPEYADPRHWAAFILLGQ